MPLMLSKYFVSVLMPVYNGESFLRESIDSILQQSFENFELIIINDGSVDTSEKIINSYSDNRIVYVKNEVNIGIIKTLNRGIGVARGEFIARMDADDISLPVRFERQIEIFKTYPAFDIVNINAYHLSENGQTYREKKSSITLSFESIRYLSVFQNFICHPGVMIKSEILKKYLYRDDPSTQHIEDFDLWIRMFNEGHMCYTIDEPLLHYRDNSSSITHTRKAEQIDRIEGISRQRITELTQFEFSSTTLELVISENSTNNFQSLVSLNTELKTFFLDLEAIHPISITAFGEMQYWRQQKVILIMLKSLSLKYPLLSFRILVFIIFHLNWFINSKHRKFLAKVFLNREKQRL